MSDNLRANGWHVSMITVGYSWVSKLRGDRRFEQLEGGAPVAGETRHDDSLTSFFAFSPLHPFSVRKPLLDALLHPLHQSFPWYWSGKLPRYLDGADLVVLESGPPVMLAPQVRRAAPDAAFVYRVSDDIHVHGVPRFLARAEMAHAPLFDRISVASRFLARRFAHLDSLRIDPMGVAKSFLDGDLPDPFAADRSGRYQAVCAGTTQFDADSINMMAALRPDWTFHVLGRLKTVLPDAPPNLILHGEVPFSTAAAYVKYADAGLAPYLDKPGAEYQTEQSNRMLMYRYFGLPMIGPHRICDPEVPRLVGYAPGSRDSMAAALGQLGGMRRGPSDPAVQDWSVLYERIVSTPKPA
uniref:GumK N-terminal domain-containing glycosyltransferase n=1 Tax=Leisingera sp. ANG-S5 TaxID=1577901 RepID=UPI000B0D65AE|nr:hypothetical protein [Leisingera sp. ANG-S5]